MFDLIIIGSGPAGISASLYAVTAKINVCVISNGRGSLEKADSIQNYYGFASPVKASKLYDDSVANAERLGVSFINDEIVGISYENGFALDGLKEKYSCNALIIATGSARKTPKIEGLNDFIGHGVSFCATCDAFFFRNKTVAVLGAGEFACHEAEYLSHVCKSVSILTNGRDLNAALPENVIKDSRKIASVSGNTIIEKVIFEDGTEKEVSGLFIAEGVAGSDALARKLGALTENGCIKTDGNMKTNIDGLFAAGDCTGGLLQICKAVSDGAIAATSAIKFLRRK